jgi:hypothetical protein
MKAKRPRISQNTNSIDTLFKYGEVFQENAASKNAKFLLKFEENLILEFWLDKHYLNRKNFGDENGARLNIDETFIQLIIEKSLKHLFYYSLKHSKFSFVNFPPPKNRNIRLVLREKDSNLEELNIVVEYHFIDFHKYEVTVITAMRSDEFRMSDGQYSLFFEKDQSTLIIYQNKKETVIDTFY